MNKFIFIFLSLTIGLASHKSLAQAFETTVETKMGYKSAVCIDYPYPESITEKAIDDYFKKEGLKGKRSSGFTQYKDVKFSPFGHKTMTILTKTERKGKKSDNSSKVYVLVSLVDGEFISSSSSPEITSKVKSFLNRFDHYLEYNETNIKCDKRADMLKETQKELDDLVSDSIKSVKAMEKLLKKIDQNREDISSKRKDLSIKKQLLDEVLVKQQNQRSRLPNLTPHPNKP